MPHSNVAPFARLEPARSEVEGVGMFASSVLHDWFREPSREAAKERSPQRQLWVSLGKMSKTRRGVEKLRTNPRAWLKREPYAPAPRFILLLDSANSASGGTDSGSVTLRSGNVAPLLIESTTISIARSVFGRM